MAGDPQQTTEFVLGQITAKLDDIHTMVHAQDYKLAEAIKELHAADKQQQAHIDSLIKWRARVRGMFAVVLALPALAWGLLKIIGHSLLGV